MRDSRLKNAYAYDCYNMAAGLKLFITLANDWKKSCWFQQNYFPIFDACAPMRDMMCDAYSYISDSLAPRAVRPGGSQRRRGRSGAWPPP